MHLRISGEALSNRIEEWSVHQSNPTNLTNPTYLTCPTNRACATAPDPAPQTKRPERGGPPGRVVPIACASDAVRRRYCCCCCVVAVLLAFGLAFGHQSVELSIVEVYDVQPDLQHVVHAALAVSGPDGRVRVLFCWTPCCRGTPVM